MKYLLINPLCLQCNTLMSPIPLTSAKAAEQWEAFGRALAPHVVGLLMS